LANGQNNLKSQFDIFINTAEKLINDQVDYAMNMNKYYVAVSSVLMILLIVGSLYLIATVLRFKARILTFFAEIDRNSMLISAQTAREFYRFLITDDKNQLEKSKKILENYSKNKNGMFDKDGNLIASG
jgi:hypothetical protein